MLDDKLREKRQQMQSWWYFLEPQDQLKEQTEEESKEAMQVRLLQMRFREQDANIQQLEAKVRSLEQKTKKLVETNMAYSQRISDFERNLTKDVKPSKPAAQSFVSKEE